MAKEKFERSKPHVNIGTIGLQNRVSGVRASLPVQT